MLCPQGHRLPVPDFTAQFCPTCGAALINPCPVGHDNVANARFCRDCGRSMGLPSGTPTLATVAAVPPTTAVVRPTGAASPTTGRSVGVRPAAVDPPPPLPDPNDPGAQRDRAESRDRVGRGWLIAIGAIAVAVVAVVIALVATASGHSSPSASSSAAPPVTRAPSTTMPASTTTSTTLSPEAAPQGRALTALLAQNASNRSQVGTATAAIAACGDLAGAQSTLAAAQASRQTLLGQLGQLDLSALPQSAALINALTTAWQSSASSDGSYAQWAADEQAKPCVPNDSADPSYQAALVSDGHASTAKQQFTSLWNPIATSLGLQPWPPNQL